MAKTKKTGKPPAKSASSQQSASSQKNKPDQEEGEKKSEGAQYLSTWRALNPDKTARYKETQRQYSKEHYTSVTEMDENQYLMHKAKLDADKDMSKNKKHYSE